MSYGNLKSLLHLLILSYVLAALVLGHSAHPREIFPLFSWSLFTHVPVWKNDFAILVTELDGRPLEPPRDFMESPDLFPGAGNIRAFYTLQDLGVALLRRRGAEVARLRQLFESEYMAASGKTLRYLVVLRSYDPVARWRGGAYEFRPVADLTLAGEER